MFGHSLFELQDYIYPFLIKLGWYRDSIVVVNIEYSREKRWFMKDPEKNTMYIFPVKEQLENKFNPEPKWTLKEKSTSTKRLGGKEVP